MFNGQMLFERQMHVKIVCVFLVNESTQAVKMNTINIGCLCLQDEKSLPPDDFHQAEKTPQLPREYIGSLV